MKLRIGIAVVASLGLLAGCSTAPPPPPAPIAVAVPKEEPLPYRWTQGNAPKAYEEAVALFGPLNLRPGQYRWLTTMPEKGEA